MYQAVHYDFNEHKYYLRDDKEGWSNFKYQPTFFKDDPYGEYTTIFGNTVSPVDFYNKKVKLYESDVDKITRILVDRYYQLDDTPSYHNLLYFDIECRIVGDLTPQLIKKAPSEITSIALYNNNTKEYFCYILDEKGRLEYRQTDNIFIIPCKTEKELLQLFLKKWKEIDPTIVVGFNCIPVTESVWLKDRIENIGNIKYGDNMFNYGNVSHIFPKSIKDKYEITLSNNKKIYSSKDHIYPFYFKNKGSYKNSNSLLKNKDEKSLENILSLFDDKDLYLRIDKHVNINDDLKYGKLCEVLNIECDESLSNTIISNDDLRLLGMIYTDGSLKEKNQAYICNSDKKLIERYIPIVNKFRKKSQLNIDNCVEIFVEGLSTKINYRLNFSLNNCLGILANFIRKGNEKKLDKNLLSLLSYNQFISFYSGLLDGDGSITNTLITLCNYNNDVDTLCELLLWNNVFSYVSSKNNLISIPSTIHSNIEFIKSLDLYSDFRKEKIRNINVQIKKNRISNNIKFIEYDDFYLVKIKNITNTNERVEMIDIETQTHYFITNGVVTHNCNYFDIPYTFNRICRVLGYDAGLSLSPINIVVTNDDEEADYPVEICGLNQLDFLILFKKYIVKQEPSYKLGKLGIKYVKMDKIEYYGNLDRLFEEDPEKFIAYNIRDVEILVAMEAKLKFIDLTVTICHLCHTSYKNIIYSTTLNDAAVLTYLKRKGIVSPNKPTSLNPALKDLKTPYAGGFLKDPIPGLYELIIDLDFTSLYPSIIRSLNIGIETLLGRVVGNGKYDNSWTLRDMKNKDPEMLIILESLNPDMTLKKTRIPLHKLIKFIEDNNIIVSAAGVLFDRNKLSIVCEILGDWFAKRKEYKDKMKAADKSGDEVLAEFYNRRQHSYKIKLNDVYGVFALNSWRYTDGYKMISSAITLTGQTVTKESIRFTNDYIVDQIKNTPKGCGNPLEKK